jgi:hypothetical protein
MDIKRPTIDPAPTMRVCGTCTLCCKVLGIEALKKPPGRWCERCKVGTGCNMYEARPAECRGFVCGFLILPELDENWRPSASRLVIGFEGGSKTMLIQVDPDRPDAWKRAPYYQRLKEWSRRAVAGRAQVIVMIGLRAIVILPDRDVDLGLIGDDEMIVTEETRTARGIQLNAVKLKRKDPRATQLIPSEQHPGIALDR